MHFDHLLTPLDAAFLHIESERSPMHMASIGIFDAGTLLDARGQLRIDDLRARIDARLDSAPKLRQRPKPGLLGQAPPSWQDDPDFDIRNHVQHTELSPPGTERQLFELCSEVLARPLDRTRPLWDLTFVTGMEDHRVAVIERLHHSMADGIAAAELATVLLDISPDASAPEPSPQWVATPAPPALTGALSDLVALSSVLMRVPAWIGWGVLHPIRRAAGLEAKGRAILSLARSGLVAPRSPLNRPNGSRKEFHAFRMDLPEVKRVARASGSAKVNDVVLAVVAGGLRTMLSLDETGSAPTSALALVPVGLDAGLGRAMTNRVSALFVRLPLDVSDPQVTLRMIATQTGEAKRDHQEDAAGTALGLLDPLPQGVLALGSRFIRRQPFFNLIVTNVPGPSFPLYALGAQMTEAFPVVPLLGNQGLGIAALSYLDSINLGLFSDPDVCPDVAAFCRGAQETFDLLCRLSDTRVPEEDDTLPGRHSPSRRDAPVEFTPADGWGTDRPSGHRSGTTARRRPVPQDTPTGLPPNSLRMQTTVYTTPNPGKGWSETSIGSRRRQP
jgi:WS/DGAT/MGAT family acyltransferase